MVTDRVVFINCVDIEDGNMIAIGENLSTPYPNPRAELKLTYSVSLGSHNESRQLFEHNSYSQAVVPKADAKLNSILVCGTASASPTSQAAQANVDSKRFSTNFLSDALHSEGYDITFGFWTLNRKHYLEDFVLSRINVLHEATEISVDPPTWGPYEDGEIGEERYHPTHKLKRDFAHRDDDGRLVSPMGFSRTGSCYTWTSNSGSGVDQIKHDQPKLDLRNVYSSTCEFVRFGRVWRSIRTNASSTCSNPFECCVLDPGKRYIDSQLEDEHRDQI